jgi:hypothetical protein
MTSALMLPSPSGEFGAPARKLIIAALLTALAIPAAGGDTSLPTETVTVSSDSLAGVWKITMPEGWSGVIGKTEWGPAMTLSAVSKIFALYSRFIAPD